MSNTTEPGTFFEFLFTEGMVLIVFLLLFVTSFLLVYRMFKDIGRLKNPIRIIHVIALVMFLVQLFAIRMVG